MRRTIKIWLIGFGIPLFITALLYVVVNLEPTFRPLCLILAAIAWGIGLTSMNSSGR